MKEISLYVPEPYLKAIDDLVKMGFYPNRAEAIRMAIHDLLQINHRTNLDDRIVTFFTGRLG